LLKQRIRMMHLGSVATHNAVQTTVFKCSFRHRRRSGWNSGGGRTASAEGGSVSSEVKYGGLGERRELPSGVRGTESRSKTDFGVFWR